MAFIAVVTDCNEMWPEDDATLIHRAAGFQLPFLKEVIEALEGLGESMDNPYNASAPNGPTLWDWYEILRKEMLRRGPHIPSEVSYE